MAQNGYKIINSEIPHFITLTVVEWVDVFSRADYRYILTDSLKFCQERKGLIIHAWVIMSNHMHLIVSAKRDHYLNDILRDFKKFTASKILREIEYHPYESRKKWMLRIFSDAGKNNSKNTCYQFWQQRNHPIELNTNELIDQKTEYIHNNPVTADIIDQPEEYLFSSARDYNGSAGLLKIELLD